MFFGMIYFDIQVVCVSEVSSIDIYTKSTPWRIRLSYVTSLIILSFMVYEILRAITLI